MPKDFKALHKNRVLTKIVSQNFLISKEKGQYLCAIIYIVSIIQKQTSCLEAQFSQSPRLQIYNLGILDNMVGKTLTRHCHNKQTHIDTCHRRSPCKPGYNPGFPSLFVGIPPQRLNISSFLPHPQKLGVHTNGLFSLALHPLSWKVRGFPKASLIP